MVPIIVKLSHYGLIKISGQDAEKFLQGQLSCDVTKISDNNSSLGAYCNIKGRIECIFRIFKYASDFYIRLPIELVSDFVEQLTKYIILSKVEIKNVTDSFYKIGIINIDKTPEKIADNITICSQLQTNQLDNMTRLEFYTNNLAAEKIFIPTGNQADWDTQEILSGIPEVYPKTVAMFLPHYLNLPALGAVSFDKGCYKGQEIIARMEYLGKIKRTIYMAKIKLSNDNIYALAKSINPGQNLYSTTPQHPVIVRTVIRKPYMLALLESSFDPNNQSTVLGSGSLISCRAVNH